MRRVVALRCRLHPIHYAQWRRSTLYCICELTFQKHSFVVSIETEIFTRCVPFTVKATFHPVFICITQKPSQQPEYFLTCTKRDNELKESFFRIYIIHHITMTIKSKLRAFTATRIPQTFQMSFVWLYLYIQPTAYCRNFSTFTFFTHIVNFSNGGNLSFGFKQNTSWIAI